MPIYEYVCDECGHQHEHLAKSMNELEPVKCPKCNTGSLHKKLSLFSAALGSSHFSEIRQGGCGRCGDPDGPCS